MNIHILFGASSLCPFGGKPPKTTFYIQLNQTYNDFIHFGNKENMDRMT